MTSTGQAKMTNDTIGIDISKDRLDARRPSTGEVVCFPNSPAGLHCAAASGPECRTCWSFRRPVPGTPFSRAGCRDPAACEGKPVTSPPLCPRSAAQGSGPMPLMHAFRPGRSVARSRARCAGRQKPGHPKGGVDRLHGVDQGTHAIAGPVPNANAGYLTR